MGVSLGFHIIFASVGIAMPLLMVMAEIRWRRTGDRMWLDLARRWAKGTAVFFAIGAVSGTVLSFELGLLFPTFMEQAGAVIGLPFSLEGIAFFTEAIFLGLYLYGWDRLRPTLHVFAGIMVAVSGAASAIFVTCVNAWMNSPGGYKLEDGAITVDDPYAALASPFALHQVPHTLLAAYLTTTLAVAGIHAWALRKRPHSAFHAAALKLAITVTIPCALLQPVIGHFAGQQVAEHQPLKFAAMEGLEVTQAAAPIEIGPFQIPGALSWLATNDASAVVVGLDAFPTGDHPSSIVQPAFRVMVALGSAMALFALVAIARRIRRRSWTAGRWWLAATIALAPTGAIAMETGWIVTEVGRQPWTIYGVLRTSEAATPLGTMWLPFTLFSVIYVGLAAVVVAILRSEVRASTVAS